MLRLVMCSACFRLGPSEAILQEEASTRAAEALKTQRDQSPAFKCLAAIDRAVVDSAEVRSAACLQNPPSKDPC